MENNQLITVASVSGLVSILDHDLKLVCSFETESQFFAGAVKLGDDQFVVGSNDGSLYWISVDSSETKCRLVFKYKFESALVRSVAVNRKQYIVAICTQGYGVLFRSNGQMLAEFSLAGECFSTPVFVDDDRFLVGCRDNFLYCYEINENKAE